MEFKNIRNKISEIDIKDLHGDWYFEREILSENSNQNSESYSYLNYKSFKIINDSIIDFKIPFLYAIDTKIKNENDEYVSNSLSLGSESEFTLSNNKIRYLNKENYKWETIFVEKVEDNKLYIKFDVNGNTFVYKKNTSTVLDNTNYDTIILTQGSCFGSCPINSTYLNRNGEFYFKSTEFNTVINGLYSSTLENNQSLKILYLWIRSICIRSVRIRDIRDQDTCVPDTSIPDTSIPDTHVRESKTFVSKTFMSKTFASTTSFASKTFVFT